MTTQICDDGLARCHWCCATPDYIDYHDNEWGYPVVDDRTLFEKICLEGFQAGLSWRTILTKREHFRAAFKNFDARKVAQFTERDVEALLSNEGIVRHRGKIEATINNARKALELIASEGSLGAYFWRYEIKNPSPTPISTSPESIAISKDLKKRGWKFVGPTTVYSFMQAMGLVNDHHKDCFAHKKAAEKRRAFKLPR